jgi:pilus assembly protein FimV
MFRKLAIPSILLVFSSPGVLAMGLGEIEMQSALNQPMQAEIDLTSSAGTDLKDIKVSVATLAAHQRAGLTKTPILSDFRFHVEKGADGNAIVRVTSTDPVREPYLEFMLELDWPKGHLLRQYTVLVDPPVTMPAVTPVTAPARTQAALRAPDRPLTETPVTLPPVAAAPVATAPAVAPAPVTPAAATRESAPATREIGPIRRTDTLWSIAQQLRPDGSVSVPQVMQALLRANPDAFMGGNINRMKLGATLRVPSVDEMRAMSAQQAAAESTRQNREWQAEISAGSQQAAADNQAPLDTAGSPAQASTPAAAHLTLVAPESKDVDSAAAAGDAPNPDEKSAQGDKLEQQLALATEAAEASQAQSAELQSRVSDLEQQVNTMKRLLELKDNALAQLQQKSAQQTPEDRKPAAQPAAKPAAVTPASVRPAAESRGVMAQIVNNPLLAGGAAIAVLLLGVLLRLISRKRNPEGFDEDMTLESRMAQQGDSREPAPAFDSLDVTVPRYQEEELQAPVPGHDSDPLTEADVYIAYGRIQQAEELLHKALELDPDNDDLRLKLLEVYHASGNVAAFVQAAGEFHDGVTEDDERWMQVAEMGYALDPGNELFHAATPDQATGSATGVDGLQDQVQASGDLPEGMDFNLDDYAIEIEDEQEGVLTTEDEVTTKLDLARAYIDMDDRESARNILDEVMEEGNSDQKQEAERIIARMA